MNTPPKPPRSVQGARITPFRTWRTKLNLTQAQVALALDVCPRQVIKWDQLPVLPRRLELAMLALDIGRSLLDPSVKVPL